MIITGKLVVTSGLLHKLHNACTCSAPINYTVAPQLQWTYSVNISQRLQSLVFGGVSLLLGVFFMHFLFVYSLAAQIPLDKIQMSIRKSPPQLKQTKICLCQGKSCALHLRLLTQTPWFLLASERLYLLDLQGCSVQISQLGGPYRHIRWFQSPCCRCWASCRAWVSQQEQGGWALPPIASHWQTFLSACDHKAMH